MADDVTSLERYLAPLPRGIDAYPQCQAKGSIVRAYLMSKPLVPDGSEPAALRKTLEHPVLAASWVPEVHFLAIALLIRQRFFTSDAAFLHWVRELNAELFRSALYRVMMFVASTRMMTTGATRRWRQFHLGTDLEVTHGDGPSADLAFRFPSHLFLPLHVSLFSSAVEAALEAAGAKGCRTVSLSMPSAGVAKTRIEWLP
jgi:hypothetical protein